MIRRLNRYSRVQLLLPDGHRDDSSGYRQFTKRHPCRTPVAPLSPVLRVFRKDPLYSRDPFGAGKECKYVKNDHVMNELVSEKSLFMYVKKKKRDTLHS